MKTKRIIVLALVVLALCLCSFTCEGGRAEIEAVSCDSGIINSMTLTIESLPSGEYEICFADENGKWLPFYTSIASFNINKGEKKSILIENVVIPPQARELALVNENNQYFLDEAIKIPDTCLNLGKEMMVFGALSDVHFNRYNALGYGDDALYSFDIALDYYESVDADLVCIAGDISRGGEESAFEKYNQLINGREYEVLTCTGNHDVSAIDTGIWEKYISSEMNTLDGVVEVAQNGIDLIYTENGQDVFVFLSQMYWDYNKEDSRLLDDSQLLWLRQALEKNKDKRVYLFFHTLLCGPDGKGHTGVGNLKNPGGYEYDLPYTYGTPDEVELRGLLAEYKNVTFFSGHSHWQFEMEKYNESTNFSSFDGQYGYMVHIPSVTEPRYIGESDTSRTGMNGKSSQGWLIYAYEECTILLPIDFMTSTIYTEYMELIPSCK